VCFLPPFVVGAPPPVFSFFKSRRRRALHPRVTVCPSQNGHYTSGMDVHRRPCFCVTLVMLVFSPGTLRHFVVCLAAFSFEEFHTKYTDRAIAHFILLCNISSKHTGDKNATCFSDNKVNRSQHPVHWKLCPLLHQYNVRSLFSNQRDSLGRRQLILFELLFDFGNSDTHTAETKTVVCIVSHGRTEDSCSVGLLGELNYKSSTCIRGEDIPLRAVSGRNYLWQTLLHSVGNQS